VQGDVHRLIVFNNARIVLELAFAFAGRRLLHDVDQRTDRFDGAGRLVRDPRRPGRPGCRANSGSRANDWSLTSREQVVQGVRSSATILVKFSFHSFLFQGCLQDIDPVLALDSAEGQVRGDDQLAVVVAEDTLGVEGTARRRKPRCKAPRRGNDPPPARRCWPRWWWRSTAQRCHAAHPGPRVFMAHWNSPSLVIPAGREGYGTVCAATFLSGGACLQGRSW